MFASVGTLSLIYYFTCIWFAHAGVSWLWIWPLLTAFCAVRFLMLQFNIKAPKWISVPYHIGLICFITAFIIIEGKIILYGNIEPAHNLDYVITLGAAVRNDLPTTPLVLRIDTTADYLLSNPGTVCVASGGQGANESMSEAECIRRYLTAYGIDERRIIKEDRSTDTFQNITYCFEIIPEDASVGVISNDFHIYRAVRTAQLLGHEVYPVPAPSLLPLAIHYTVREFFAVLELELKNII